MGEYRSSVGSSMGGGFTILAGLKRPSGSKLRFTSSKAATMRLPSIGSRNSDRTIPSPCSPECEPLNSRTRACASSAIWRILDRSLLFLRLSVGLMWRHPTDACAYQVPVVPCFANTSPSRAVYSASLSSGTAQSSMNDTGLPSPFMDITMLSASFRTLHI